MAKVLVTCGGDDVEVTDVIVNMLSGAGHHVTAASGHELDVFYSLASKHIGVVDCYLPIVSINAASNEAQAGINRFIETCEGMGTAVFPLVVDRPNVLPDTVRRLIQVHVSSDNPPGSLSNINMAIEAALERRRSREIRFEEVKEDLSLYVNEAIKRQEDAEKRNRRLAHFWYVGGVVSLWLVLVFASILLWRAIGSVNAPGTSVPGVQAVALFVFGVVVVGVFAALARYAYSLGKSYMTESLKSADRIHAIQFGQFFLKAYGDRLTPAEVKESFQHWNIDRTSTFASLDPAHIDPQIYTLITQLFSAIAGKKEK